MACYPGTNIPAILHPFCSAKNVEKDLLPSSEIVEQLLILLFSLDSKCLYFCTLRRGMEREENKICMILWFHDLSVRFQPLFLNLINHIFRVLSPNRPFQELNIKLQSTTNVIIKLSLSSQKRAHIFAQNLQVFSGRRSHLPPSSSRWPPSSFCFHKLSNGRH